MLLFIFSLCRLDLLLPPSRCPSDSKIHLRLLRLNSLAMNMVLPCSVSNWDSIPGHSASTSNDRIKWVAGNSTITTTLFLRRRFPKLDLIPLRQEIVPTTVYAIFPVFRGDYREPEELRWRAADDDLGRQRRWEKGRNKE